MKVVILYRPKSEFARGAEQYAQDFERLNGSKIEMVDMDSPQGVNLVELYDAMQNPTLLAVADDGQMLNMWPGPKFPLMQEVAGYLLH